MSETENNEKRSNDGDLIIFDGSTLDLAVLVIDLCHISLETLEIAGFDGIYGQVELLEFWRRRLAVKLLLIARVIGSGGKRFWFGRVGRWVGVHSEFANYIYSGVYHEYMCIFKLYIPIICTF